MFFRLDFLLLLIYVPLNFTKNLNLSNTKCDIYDLFLKNPKKYCWHDDEKYSKILISKTENSLYILYDVNPGEGFNLRRDVYIRLAVFVRNLRQIPKYKNAELVLPPFPHLYHWKSRDIYQNQMFWSEFFDLESLKRFTSVVDFWEFFNKLKKLNPANNVINIDHIYRMKYFENVFENGKFLEKFEVNSCFDDPKYKLKYIFGYENITAKQFSCLHFQGSAGMLKDFLDQQIGSLDKPHIILLLHAETVLHDHWGNRDYWEARRSMRFNKNLITIASKFRKHTFDSTDESDLVQRPFSWVTEKYYLCILKPYRNAIGGNYLCAHIRRADFVQGREKFMPTILSIAAQIKLLLRNHNVHNVFISSDCTKSEFKDLKNHLIRYKVTRFSPETNEEKKRIKDGGIAIVDQIICSNAKVFIGTYESTFTYRIYEEREILGFPRDLTFNTFCKYDDGKNCEKNSVWPISY